MFRGVASCRWRVSAALAAVSFLCASLGVLPTGEWLARLGVQLSGERFPCENGRCGCASARECWTACLCQSLAEKIAWCEREGVAVPSFVDVSADAGSSAPAPACPLCVSDDAPTDAAPTRGGPDLTPLGCKGLRVLAAAGVVIGLTAALVPPTPSEDRAAVCWAPNVCAPRSRALDVASPPPRA